MKVIKFGGSSVGTPERIKTVVGLIMKAASEDKVAVVISAFQGVTDNLLKVFKLASSLGDWQTGLEELKTKHLEFGETLLGKDGTGSTLVEKRFDELTKLLSETARTKDNSLRSQDAVIGYGELLSCSIISEYGKALGYPFQFVDARGLVKTDSTYSNARVNFRETNKLIRDYFSTNNNVTIITGFIGQASDGSTTTLGRSGSDYTASIFGAALDVSIIEIWTDVSGVMTADPRVVPEAFVLPRISYEEAMEMSYFGAKVIHPQTVQPAVVKNIPLLIKNTFEPDAPGTIISKDTTDDGLIVKGIAAIDNCSLVIVEGAFMIGIVGSAARVLKAFSNKKVNVILMTQGSSEYTICLGIKKDDVAMALSGLEEEFKVELEEKEISFNVRENQCIVAVVGDGMKGKTGVAGKLFQTLGARGINIDAIAQGGSERNISVVIDASEKVRAMRAIHDAFYKKEKTAHLILFGHGGVGGAFIERIRTNRNKGTNIILNGIIDSKKMLVSWEGIDLSSWNKELQEKGIASNIEELLEEVKSHKTDNVIVVDCTASEDIPSRYIDFIRAGAHIVSANKKGNIVSMSDYSLLREALSRYNKCFFYETNVGGGLPILSSLRRLLDSGDKVESIEAVLSGTLSYLMNSYDGSTPWSELVLRAKDNGLTEPDPRDDLSGMDVARKLLILVRELGCSAELGDIEVESLVPEECKKMSKEEFMKNLHKYDGNMVERFDHARLKGALLRYVARYIDNKLSVKLEEVLNDHPLAHLRGTDNVFVLRSALYNKTPLIIQGPGAGREVTAAGVLADIIKVVNR